MLLATREQMTSSETLGIVLMPETHHGSPVFSFGFPSVVFGLSFSTKDGRPVNHQDCKEFG